MTFCRCGHKHQMSLSYNWCCQTSCRTMIVLVLSDCGSGQQGLRSRRRKATGSTGGDIVQNRADARRISMSRFCNVSRSVALVSCRAPPATCSHKRLKHCCHRPNRVEYFHASFQLLPLFKSPLTKGMLNLCKACQQTFVKHKSRFDCSVLCWYRYLVHLYDSLGIFCLLQ